MILDIAIYLFVALELANVFVMYFKPGFRHANSMAVFAAWGRAQPDENQRLFVTYLVRWVANCKVIFIALFLIIALFATEAVKFWAVVVATVSIALYYVTLHPLIRKLDAQGEIQPAGYSKTLALNIAAFLLLFVGASTVYLFASIAGVN